MKNFSKFIICLLICVFCLGLTACGKTNTYLIHPSADAVVVGNGGMVVTKGDYVYFVNGYSAIADKANSDRNNSYTVGALMVAKMDSNGNLILNEDELLSDEYYNFISRRLCGFEATALYIYDNYLYFTTPSLEDDKSENWAKDRVDFYRVKLDNSGDMKKLYTTEVSNSNVEFNFYNNGQQTFALVYEKGTNLDHSNISNRLLRISGSGDKLEVARNVTSALLEETAVEETENGKNLFYFVKEDDEYQLKHYNVFENASEDFGTPSLYTSSIPNASSFTATVKFSGNGYVYIQKTVSYSSNASHTFSEIHRSSIENAQFSIICAYEDDAYSNMFLSNNASRLIVIGGNNIGFYGFAGDQQVAPIPLVSDSDGVNFMGFMPNGNMVYYDNNNVIKVVNINEQNINNVETITVATVSDVYTTNNMYDLDDNFVYFYKTVGSNIYLHRLSLNNISADEKEEMLGVYLEDDIPEKEETTD